VEKPILPVAQFIVSFLILAVTCTARPLSGPFQRRKRVQLMHRTLESSASEVDKHLVRTLSPEETMQVSGGMIDNGNHPVPSHNRGRLTPDASEQGTIAAAGM